MITTFQPLTVYSTPSSDSIKIRVHRRTKCYITFEYLVDGVPDTMMGTYIKKKIRFNDDYEYIIDGIYEFRAQGTTASDVSINTEAITMTTSTAKTKIEEFIKQRAGQNETFQVEDVTDATNISKATAIKHLDAWVKSGEGFVSVPNMYDGDFYRGKTYVAVKSLPLLKNEEIVEFLQKYRPQADKLSKNRRQWKDWYFKVLDKIPNSRTKENYRYYYLQILLIASSVVDETHTISSKGVSESKRSLKATKSIVKVYKVYDGSTRLDECDRWLDTPAYIYQNKYAVIKTNRGGDFTWQVLMVAEDGKTYNLSRRYTDQLYSGFYRTKKKAELAIYALESLKTPVPTTPDELEQLEISMGAANQKLYVEEVFNALNSAHQTPE